MKIINKLLAALWTLKYAIVPTRRWILSFAL